MNTNIERPKASKPRIRHTMIRVKDLEHSTKFYTEVLGMQVFRRSDNEGGKYTVVFLGYGDIAICFPDIYEIWKKVEPFGMEVPLPPGPLKHTGPNGPVIAFIRDPDGYSIELGERA